MYVSCEFDQYKGLFARKGRKGEERGGGMVTGVNIISVHMI